MADVTMVRIYWREGKGSLQAMLERLHEEERVRGVTVFRGVAGYGGSGRLHTNTLVDLSLELPLVIEFFDTPERAAKIIDDLHDTIGPGHIVSWPAQVND